VTSQCLIVFLHGIGASGAQLMPLASSWQSGLPHARFIFPDAPFHCFGGHEWFSVVGNPLDPDRMRAARTAFDDLVNDIINREGFAGCLHRTAFDGVSQGAIVALDGIASGRWKIGALVSFAGLLPPQAVSLTSRNTPIFLGHGQLDTTIPAAASTLAAARLRHAGFAVHLDLDPGVGHTISREGARLSSNIVWLGWQLRSLANVC